MRRKDNFQIFLTKISIDICDRKAYKGKTGDRLFTSEYAMSYGTLLYTNFEQLNALNAITGNYKLSTLFGILRYQVKKTKINKNGKKVIARTREQIAKAMGCGLSAVDRLLERLITLGLIEGKVGMWHGNKRMFISCKEDLDLSLDLDKLHLMNAYTGGNKASTMLSYFAFRMQTESFLYKGKRHVMVARKYIAKLLDITSKSADVFMMRLAERGLIEYEGWIMHTQRQYIVHINDDFYKNLTEEWIALKEAKRIAKLEETKESIIITKDPKEKIINNNTLEARDSETGIIILSKKEQSYLRAAVVRTLQRVDGLAGQLETLVAQVKYALSNENQRKGTQSFAHAVNRAMKLIREGVWKPPFGWFKYTEEGQKMKQESEPVNMASRFTVKGEGSIMMYDYSVQEGPERTPSVAEIFEERNRLSKLDISLEEKNQSLRAKFGWYAESHLLRA